MTMEQDEAIAAIRSVRQEISARYGHNTKALIRHFQDIEKKYQDRLLRPAAAIPAASAPSTAEGEGSQLARG